MKSVIIGVLSFAVVALSLGVICLVGVSWAKTAENALNQARLMEAKEKQKSFDDILASIEKHACRCTSSSGSGRGTSAAVGAAP